MGRKKKEETTEINEQKVEQPKYEVPKKFREVPRAYKVDGVWVGVGGKIVRKGIPPHGDTVIPEATDEQYLKIAETNSYLVKKL